MNIPPSWFSCFWYDVCGEHSHTVVGNFQDYRYRYCMHEEHFGVTDRISDDKWPENIVRKKKTNATKYPLARRKDAQAWLVDGQPASGSHDKRTSPTNLQLPAAPAIGSGGNKLPLRCRRCSPSRHERVFRNKTLPTKRRASSLRSWSAKGQISSKHAGEPKIFSGENLRKDPPNTLTATRSCTLRSLFAHRSWQQTKSTIFSLVFWTHTQSTERLIIFVAL